MVSVSVTQCLTQHICAFIWFEHSSTSMDLTLVWMVKGPLGAQSAAEAVDVEKAMPAC